MSNGISLKDVFWSTKSNDLGRYRYIEKLSTIAEPMISFYPTMSQQFLSFKKLSFVGAIWIKSRLKTLEGEITCQLHQ